jgi:hypothetical protein
MALRRLTNDDKMLPETVDDDDTNLSFHQKLMKNARKNAKEGKRSFVCIIKIASNVNEKEFFIFNIV